MTDNIESIDLWKGDHNYNGIPLVRVNFKFPCTWTVFDIDELLKILELWIEGEEIRYPREKGFKGRLMLFEKIKEVFEK